MSEAKRSLRRELLARRQARVADDGQQMARQAALLRLPEVEGAGTVAAYYALPGEPETATLIEVLDRTGRVVLLPVLQADGSLLWATYDGSFQPGLLGTNEPTSAPDRQLSEAELVVVPALACDPQGRRLGRGGGSYDRALPTRRPGTPAVALLWDDEVLDEVPVECHDAGVDLVVTELRAIRCR